MTNGNHPANLTNELAELQTLIDDELARLGLEAPPPVTTVTTVPRLTPPPLSTPAALATAPADTLVVEAAWPWPAPTAIPDPRWPAPTDPHDADDAEEAAAEAEEVEEARSPAQPAVVRRQRPRWVADVMTIVIALAVLALALAIVGN